VRGVLLSAAVVLTVPGTVAAQAPDFDKVEIKTTKVGDNLYLLEGQGGTIAALAGNDGVFLVDSQFAPLTDKIVAAIKKITDRPIRFLVNTHVHGDHTGGNENFAKLGVTLISRDELRARLAQPPKGAPPAPALLPILTYQGSLTLHMNGEEARLIAVPVAHTDGDTMVKFMKADLIMTGDFYRSVGYPNIDRANGGTLKGMLEGLAAVVAQSGPNTRIVPGHGPVVDRVAVTGHRDMIIALRDRVAALIKEGKTQQDVVAAKPNADYDSKVPQPGTTGDRFLGQLYAELTGGK
jgi:glyoxylase-like metal-dependent hydrolase (beta-lactamase superfamily II)